MKDQESKKKFEHYTKYLEIPEIDIDEEISLINDNKYLDKINHLYSNIKSKNKVLEDKLTSESFDEAAKRVELDSQAISTFCEVIKEDTKIKKIYSIILIMMLGIELIVVNGVFILMGLKLLEYNEITLNIFIGGTLAEILGLVLIIVKYLFKDNITHALNNILVNNKINK